MKKLLLLSMLAIMLGLSWGDVDLTMSGSDQTAKVIINAEMCELKWRLVYTAIFDSIHGRTDEGSADISASDDTIIFKYADASTPVSFHPLDSMTICFQIGNIGGVTIDMKERNLADEHAETGRWSRASVASGTTPGAGALADPDKFILVGVMKKYKTSPTTSYIAHSDFGTGDANAFTEGATAASITSNHIATGTDGYDLANENGLCLVPGDPQHLTEASADEQDDWITFFVKYVNPLSASDAGLHTIRIELVAAASIAD